MSKRTASPLLAALAASLLACGPGDPPTPPGEPEDAGGGDEGGGDAGGEAGGGADAGGSGGAGGGETEWADVIGGAGAEHVQDLAAAPGGGVVALTAIGLDGDRVEALGLVAIDAGGSERAARAFGVGARVGFGAGALAAAPQGHLFLALACPAGCGDLGDEVRGTALVKLTGYDREWTAALRGVPASNVVADAAGNAALATTEEAGTFVRSYGADGAVRWELTASGGPVALAADGRGNVIAAIGGEIVALDGEGRASWTLELGDGVRIAALGASGAAVVAVGSSASGISGADVGRGPFVAVLGGDGRLRSARALEASPDAELLLSASPGGTAVVTRAGSCAARVSALDGEGKARWSRAVAPAECGGRDVSVHAVEVLEGGRVALGGALRADADLGGGVLRPSATDGFVVALRP